MLTVVFFHSLIKQPGTIVARGKGLNFYYHFSSSLIESIVNVKCRKRAIWKGQ